MFPRYPGFGYRNSYAAYFSGPRNRTGYAVELLGPDPSRRRTAWKRVYTVLCHPTPGNTVWYADRKYWYIFETSYIYFSVSDGLSEIDT